jgi:Uma2 family endonuclease
MAAEPQPRISEEEYLRLERESEVRHEYFAGEVFAMVGASRAHNLIAGNTYASLHAQLRKRPCEIYNNDMRVRVPVTKLYTYPDIIVTCGESQFADEEFDTLLNPTIIIEVLSPSTESYDRGKKFQHYRTIRSLKEYLLITQDAYHIDQFVRQGEINWLLTEHDGPTATVQLASIDCTLVLADIYEKVDVPS